MAQQKTMYQLKESYQGTLTLEQSQNITISDTKIQQNTVFKGCGGGLYILESQASSIQNNSALLYGKDVTSYPVKFQLQKDYSEILNNLISGNTLSEPILFNLIDEFEEVVIYPINYNSSQINQQILIEFESYNIQIQNQNLLQDLNIQGRTYSFKLKFSNAQDNECSGCPAQAVYCEKNTILLKNGFWRPSPDDDRIFRCSNEQNCIQEMNQNYYNVTSQMDKQLFQKSQCLEGHLGPLCESCDINQELWGERFAQNQNFQYQYFKYKKMLALLHQAIEAAMCGKVTFS
ncbi:hypothetical protein TTHERM_00580420 (macronuclear) [Tetrahymena thermophila SB210]|uniref:Transmembrane protein n=1 Tax=Tetrahymena thermophila (strain SB210) TaxID=312017 RepID=I7M391_TETTS|nr:hypothetical protein TTHERM_00580420 [Tetrahymena thermophila SB210]EAS02699.2 hypothetical protein TTHERM_00580420 [Tetrahymena thermophila SB210]|eukprot:XP_001022944.2 hypothetical protein TTHERM_00580420 [Tetrahymena thermophila SB210]